MTFDERHFPVVVQRVDAIAYFLRGSQRHILLSLTSNSHLSVPS